MQISAYISPAVYYLISVLHTGAVITQITDSIAVVVGLERVRERGAFVCFVGNTCLEEKRYEKRIVLCCAVSCRTVPCRAVPCRAVLRCAVLCCAVLCCAVLCCAVLCCKISYHLRRYLNHRRHQFHLHPYLLAASFWQAYSCHSHHPTNHHLRCTGSGS